jgi:hypothetical protein
MFTPEKNHSVVDFIKFIFIFFNKKSGFFDSDLGRFSFGKGFLFELKSLRYRTKYFGLVA